MDNGTWIKNMRWKRLLIFVKKFCFPHVSSNILFIFVLPFWTTTAASSSVSSTVFFFFIDAFFTETILVKFLVVKKKKKSTSLLKKEIKTKDMEKRWIGSHLISRFFSLSIYLPISFFILDVIFDAMFLRAKKALIMHWTFIIFFTCVSYKRERYSSL